MKQAVHTVLHMNWYADRLRFGDLVQPIKIVKKMVFPTTRVRKRKCSSPCAGSAPYLPAAVVCCCYLLLFTACCRPWVGFLLPPPSPLPLLPTSSSSSSIAFSSSFLFLQITSICQSIVCWHTSTDQYVSIRPGNGRVVLMIL